MKIKAKNLTGLKIELKFCVRFILHASFSIEVGLLEVLDLNRSVGHKTLSVILCSCSRGSTQIGLPGHR